jgi:hypothetical protein
VQQLLPVPLWGHLHRVSCWHARCRSGPPLRVHRHGLRRGHGRSYRQHQRRRRQLHARTDAGTDAVPHELPDVVPDTAYVASNAKPDAEPHASLLRDISHARHVWRRLERCYRHVCGDGYLVHAGERANGHKGDMPLWLSLV